MRQASIDYTIRNANGNVTRTYNPCGYTPSTQKQPHETFGVYLQKFMAIDIPKVVLANDTPMPGDTFVGPVDGLTYTVLENQDTSLFVNRVVGRIALINQALHDIVDYLAHVDATDKYADLIRNPLTYPVKIAAIPARIQPVTAAMADYLGLREFKNHWVVYVLVDINLSYGDVLRDNNGVYYKVLSWQSREELANAFEIICETIQNVEPQGT
jgi:hypothetical protein